MLISVSTAAADIGEVGLDVDTSGNEAAMIGEVDDCIEVSVGDEFQVDVYVRDAEELIAFTVWLVYDPAVVEITDRDVQLFLTTADTTNVLDGSAATPDADGQYELNAVNASDSSAGASGSGVLARMTLTAVGEGITELDISGEDIDGDGIIDRGTYFSDIDASPIGDEDGDTYFDGTIRNGAVAVDASCADANPAESGGDDGTDLLPVIAGAAVLLLAALGVAVLVFRRRGSGSASGTVD